MLAALYSSGEVILLEKTDSLGKKFALSGNGRGNITNLTPIQGFSEYYHNGKFLKKALFNFSNDDLIKFFNKYGIDFKAEEKKVFPVSDRAKDLVKILEMLLNKNGVQVIYNQKVTDILVKENKVIGIKTGDRELHAEKVIIATGGSSFPQTGSSGDGFFLLKKLGHHIIKPRPALVPFKLSEKVEELSGISVPDVSLTLISSGKKLKTKRGPLLFTSFGISGPAVLNLSCYLPETLENIKVKVDFFPEYTVNHLQSILSLQEAKTIKNALPEKLSQKLREWLINFYGYDKDLKVKALALKTLIRIAEALKGTVFNLNGTLPLEVAYVTAGGVDVKEINPATMESKIIKGLYLAGEVIDCHGETGGFNLQMAFSTGVLAGKS